VCVTVLLNQGRKSVQVNSVSASRVCVVCCLIHHFVMSQAKSDFEGFVMKHMIEEEKVIDLREIPLKN